MLLARVKTAVVAIVAILLILFVLPSWVIAPAILLVIAGAAWEWSVLCRLHTTSVRLAYVVTVVAGCAALWPGIDLIPTTVLLGVAGAWWCVALLFVLRYPRSVSRVTAMAAGLLVLLPAFFAMVALARYPATGNITGPTLLLFVLVTIWASDVGGYFAGRYLGKRKLAPAVSPKKTWAGVVGGLVLSAVIGFAGSAYFGLAWYRLVPLCFATGAIAVLGDLTVSLFKREAGVKDSGSLFPGHGGILDRIDSIAAATPLFVAGIVMGHGAW
ncbi:MAG: phosphatidate cytidylyltransferase [Pseudomonadota bacterium]